MQLNGLVTQFAAEATSTKIPSRTDTAISAFIVSAVQELQELQTAFRSRMESFTHLLSYLNGLPASTQV